MIALAWAVLGLLGQFGLTLSFIALLFIERYLFYDHPQKRVHGLLVSTDQPPPVILSSTVLLKSPTMNDGLKTYLANLTFTCEAPTPAPSPPAVPKRVKPLGIQLEEFTRSLPPAMLNHPWRICDLLMRLEGRYRAHPSPQKLSEQTRKSGWI